MLKLNIRGKTISYSSFKKRNRDKREQTLENKLLNLCKKDMNLQEWKEEIATNENELHIIRNESTKGIILRAKARWNVEGERSSKYFCNLEKKTLKKKKIYTKNNT